MQRIRPVWVRAAVVLIATATAGAQSLTELYPPPPVVPPPGHPRVFFTADDLPRLRANALKPQNALALNAHRANLEAGTDGVLPAPAQPGGPNMDSRILNIIASHAYEYALHGDARVGRAAIDAMHNYVRTVVYPAKDYNNTGQTVFTIGIVYDWCHALLTDDDKQRLIAAAIETAGRMEIGWPPVKQGNVTGHGPEGQIFRDLLVASIAMYDEKPEMYQVVAGRFFAKMVEPKLFMYRAHMHHQGNHYMSYRGQWEMFATLTFDAIGRPEVFGPDQRHFMSWGLYARRGDGQILRDGDTHINNRRRGTYFDGPLRTMFHVANHFGDPHLKTAVMRMRPDLEPVAPRQNQALDCVEILIFNDPDLEPRPLEELPLTKYFPTPKGAMIARTGWQEGLDSPAVVAEMKINEWYFANHQHLDAGAFQIYYRGVLANDSGYYQAGVNKTDNAANDGSTGYGSLYDVNYYKRSIAHNVMTIHDPGEVFDTKRWASFPIANDGGQRMPNRWIEPQEQAEFIDPANRYRIAEVLGHGFGPDPIAPDYTYLKGDLTDAYSEKVRGYERSFVFLNLKQPQIPAVMVVLDRVESSEAGFRKAWLMHGLEEPTIDGNRTVFKDTREGYSGKITVDTVLPDAADAIITPVGGPGYEAWVDGTNFLATLREDGVNEGHGWRIEVSPRTPREEDFFLHVLQIADHRPIDVGALEVVRVESATHIGVRVGDHVVMLSRRRDRVSEAVSFQVPGSGEARILVAGLAAGRWRAGDATTTVGEDDGVAYFDAPAGQVDLEPVR